MNRLLYPKLAWQNLRKNGTFYFPYLLTIIRTAAAFYIMAALGDTQSLPARQRYMYLQVFVVLGSVVIGIFAVIFLFYTNSFLMKRRTRELGLYHILGMGKRHIAHMLFFETLYLAAFGILGGVAVGLVFQKLVTLLLCKLIHFDVYFGFYIAWTGIRDTCLLFGGILMACYLWNLIRIWRQKSIELLHAEAVGEREPRTKWLLTLIGVAALGTGYYLAVTIDDAMQALSFYFVAVILVIIGTYCLFTAVSITVLKLLRCNKRYYYRTKHFIGISGMLYRMKRNAVGLANICILSTMVLVMVSGTLAMYLGTEDAVDSMYPYDLVATVRYDATAEPPFQQEQMRQLLSEALERGGYTVTDQAENLTFSMTVCRKADRFYLGYVEGGTYGVMTFLPAEVYEQQTGEAVSLEEGEVLVYDEQGMALPDQVEICFRNAENADGPTAQFKVQGRLQEPPKLRASTAVSAMDTYYLVVEDPQVLTELRQMQAQVMEGGGDEIQWQFYCNLDGTEEEQIACAEWLSDSGNVYSGNFLDVTGSWEAYWVESRAYSAMEFYSLNGGFFFLGMFLGLLFIVATVLIIYYKQLSEGYEDAGRYQIMQQVGLSQSQIRRAVGSQILVVFFLPLLVAAVHVAFDFKLIVLLLTLFSLNNMVLTLWCTVGTLVLFICIYGIVYALTARAYYRIVSHR